MKNAAAAQQHKKPHVDALLNPDIKADYTPYRIVLSEASWRACDFSCAGAGARAN